MEDLIGEAWAALSVDDSGASTPTPAGVRLTGSPGHLPSHFAVEDVAAASIAGALLAAAALGRQRGSRVGSVSLDRGHVADAVRSERSFRVGARRAGASFAPLSRFWPVADGWVRTHANYPWHRAALVDTLGTAPDPDAVAGALAERTALEVEEQVYAAGGIATAIRTLDAWRAHPQGRALGTERLIGHRMSPDGAARRRAPADLPMTDVRVLDLTRVIAGPVCTRFLAALGAQVLRLDPPHRPDMAPGSVADGLLGKRSACVDLATTDGVATLHHLLARADLVVCGYRPGALDRFGLGEEALVERHPGLVVVYLDAWGHSGPWAGRRGFDSVVQAPTGIATGESPTGTDPGTLPCQLLDHGTGYLAAAAAMDGIRRQGAQGGTHVRRLSLARTALWLTSYGSPAGRATDGTATEPHRTEPERNEWLVELDSARGPVTAVSPPGALGDEPLRWPSPVTAYADDPPRWPGPQASAPRVSAR